MPDVDLVDRRRHPDGVHRNQYGHAIYPADNPGLVTCSLCRRKVSGRPFQRMTTFIDVLEGRYQLENWKMRQAIRGLILKENLQVKATGAFDSDSELDEIAQRALEAADSAAGADMGTAVHDAVEAVERGERDPKIHPSIRPLIAAYRELMSSQRLAVADVECHIVIDGLSTTKTTAGLSGRFDQIVTVPEACPRCGTDRRISDVKTTKPTSFPFDFRKIPMQLAGYAAGKRIDPAAGERAELDVCQCWGLAIHLPIVDGADYVAAVYDVDLAAGREGLATAEAVWGWRRRDGLMRRRPDIQTSAGAPAPDVPAGPTSAPPAVAGEPPSGGADLHALIALAADRRNMQGLWSHFAASGQWADEHTEAAKRRLAELEAAR